jgi:hypothetical protein
MTTSRVSGLSCMAPLKTLQTPSLGFLINNSIAIGVELMQLKKVACNGIERSSFIQNKKLNGSHSWYIDDFSKLKKPSALSEPFQVGGYTWYVMKPPFPNSSIYWFYKTTTVVVQSITRLTFVGFHTLLLYSTCTCLIGIVPKSLSTPSSYALMHFT